METVSECRGEKTEERIISEEGAADRAGTSCLAPALNTSLLRHRPLFQTGSISFIADAAFYQKRLSRKGFHDSLRFWGPSAAHRLPTGNHGHEMPFRRLAHLGTNFEISPGYLARCLQRMQSVEGQYRLDDETATCSWRNETHCTETSAAFSKLFLS